MDQRRPRVSCCRRSTSSSGKAWGRRLDPGRGRGARSVATAEAVGSSLGGGSGGGGEAARQHERTGGSSVAPTLAASTSRKLRASEWNRSVESDLGRVVDPGALGSRRQEVDTGGSSPTRGPLPSRNYGGAWDDGGRAVGWRHRRAARQQLAAGALPQERGQGRGSGDPMAMGGRAATPPHGVEAAR
ncbi:unnamed protein product [Urochloa humidicola]